MKDTFDYQQFAHAYLSPWRDIGKLSATLTRIRDDAFNYDDNVKLDDKAFLQHIASISQVGPATFAIEFENVEAKINSECLAAIEDYLRVYYCERGYAESYKDSMDILGERGTEFPGLIKPKTDVEQPFKSKFVFVSLNVHPEEQEAFMQETHAALSALEQEVKRKKTTGFVDDKKKRPTRSDLTP